MAIDERIEFSINMQYRDGILTSSVVLDEKTDDVFCFFYLYMGNNLVNKDETYTREKSRTWNLMDFTSGARFSQFFVRAFVRKGNTKQSKRSELIYVTDDTDNALTDSLNATLNQWRKSSRPPALKFYHRVYPFADFCLVWNMPSDGIQAIAHSENMYYHTFAHFNKSDLEDARCACMISTVPVIKTPSADFIFGGLSKVDGRLIFGQKDAKELDDPRLLEDQIGNFFLVYQDPKHLYIGTDFLGMSKLYYYKNETTGGIIISNRYHLLVIAMKKSGIDMEIDTNKVMSYLYRNDMPYQQNFSRRMEFRNTWLQPVDLCFEISGETIREIPNEIHTALQFNDHYSEEDYARLLDAARNEVIDNVRALYQNPGIKRISFDLTGGLDTRETVIAYSCLSEAEKAEKQSRMYTVEKENATDDLLIGYEVGKAAGLSYQAWPASYELLRLDEQYNHAMSSLFGEWFIFEAAKARLRTDDTVRIDGTCGDVCGRSIYAKLMLHNGREFSSIQELLRWTDSKSITTIKSNLLRECHEEYMSSEVEMLPGRSVYEKYDMHYLFYRNGMHMGKFLSPDLDDPSWGPCQSKSMFLLKLMTFTGFPELKNRFDLFYSMNPKLAAIPFEYEGNNEARKALIEKGDLPDIHSISIEEIRASLNKVKEERRAISLQRKELVRIYDPHGERKQIEVENRGYQKRLMEWFHFAFTDLLEAENGYLKDRCGIELLHWIDESIIPDAKLSRVGRIFVNKILYFYYLRQFLD